MSSETPLENSTAKPQLNFAVSQKFSKFATMINGGWNYRILAREIPEEMYFAIHEVYYDSEGKPNAYSSEPVIVSSDSVKGIKWNLRRMLECTKKPILWAGERFPEEYDPTSQTHLNH
jgi:hypothetical protein